MHKAFRAENIYGDGVRFDTAVAAAGDDAPWHYGNYITGPALQYVGEAADSFSCALLQLRG
jgi:hypothetical protein